MSSITVMDESARDAFLSRYRGYSRKLYASDLGIYYGWCDERGISPLQAKRQNLEDFLDYLLSVRKNKASSTCRRMYAIKGLYALAEDDGLISRDPTRVLRLPKVRRDVGSLIWLDRFQVGAFLHEAEKTSAAHHALIALMAIGGLRVSAACNARIEDLSKSPYGGYTLCVQEKNGRIHTVEVPPVLAKILEASIGNRTTGTIITRRNGLPQDRNGAYAWVRLLGKKIGVDKVSPHAFRRAAITTVIDGGGSLQDARVFAGHADISTTELYHPTLGSRDFRATSLTAAAFSYVS